MNVNTKDGEGGGPGLKVGKQQCKADPETLWKKEGRQMVGTQRTHEKQNWGGI